MTKEAHQALNFLASLPSGNATLDRKDLKGLLLETGGTLLARGSLYNIKPRHLGAGVFQITLALANP